ncbi:MAG: sialidase family protein [Chloroflexota bacterium]
MSPRPTSLAGRSREPIVTAHPFDATRLAVVYAAGPGEASRPVIRISHDGGRTWRTATGRPRGGGSHPMLAWGPGPRAGTARLYYTAMGGEPGNYHFVVSYSDNEGRTWRQGFVADNTRGWFGGYEDLVVDTNPASPNYGTLYLAYNWPKDRARGTGLRVVASGDYGRTFAEAEVPKLAPPAGYGDAWRIGYKLATAPDGSAYVAGYQLDMKAWRYTAPFFKGGYSNIGRIAFGVTRLSFDREARRLSLGPTVLATKLPETAWNLGWATALKGMNVGLAEPCWATGMVVDEDGRIYFAVAGDGRIRILTSDDRGRTWRLRYLPQAPAAGGRVQRSMRPELVVGDGFVAVLFHTVDASGTSRTAGNAVAVSFDGGATWVGPRPVNGHRWKVRPIIATYNGPGLRDRAVLLADGRTIYFAYGDGRDGLTAAFGARIRVTPPTEPPPTPTPTPTPTPPSPTPPPEPTPPTTPSPTPPPSPTTPPDPTPPPNPDPIADPPPDVTPSPSAGQDAPTTPPGPSSSPAQEPTPAP